MVIPDHKLNDIVFNSFEEDNSGKVSAGISSYGYDARLADDLLIFDPCKGIPHIDPKNFDPNIVRQADRTPDGHFLIPAYGFALGHTMEDFVIPRNVLAICMGKSTYARCGLIVNVTPLEPEWYGQVTLELHNTTSLPIKVYAEEGICQFVFLRGEGMPEVSYADRKGKYQGQSGTTLPRIKGKA